MICIIGNKDEKALKKKGFAVQPLQNNEEYIICCVAEPKKENKPIAYNSKQQHEILWNLA